MNELNKIEIFNSADLFDWVVEARIINVPLPEPLLKDINASLYYHKRDDLYSYLMEDDEFMEALDWNNEAYRANS
jgi:hypothetical protein